MRLRRQGIGSRSSWTHYIAIVCWGWTDTIELRTSSIRLIAACLGRLGSSVFPDPPRDGNAEAFAVAGGIFVSLQNRVAHHLHRFGRPHHIDPHLGT
jgi:hypothetical protein